MGELIDTRTLPVRTTPTSPQVLPPPEFSARLVWTKEMDQAYIDSLFAAHNDGKRVEPGGFKDEAWVACCAAVQQVYKEYRILIKPQVKNRLVWWRNHYYSIPINMPVRWSSTHTMIDKFYRIKDAIIAVLGPVWSDP